MSDLRELDREARAEVMRRVRNRRDRIEGDPPAHFERLHSLLGDGLLFGDIFAPFGFDLVLCLAKAARTSVAWETVDPSLRRRQLSDQIIALALAAAEEAGEPGLVHATPWSSFLLVDDSPPGPSLGESFDRMCRVPPTVFRGSPTAYIDTKSLFAGPEQPAALQEAS